VTLQQFHELKVWHLRQGRRHPVERMLWDVVLTVWLLGWIGAPAAFLLGLGWAELACLSVLFLPGLYVALRRRLHNKRRLRCDWIIALRQ
jgi:hypothetical protein